MSGNIYIGDNNSSARTIKAIYIGDSSNSAKLVRAMYVGDSIGQAKLIWPTSNIPAEYQRVEYLYKKSSSGYFDTNLVPSENMKFETTFMRENNTSQLYIAGCYTSSSKSIELGVQGTTIRCTFSGKYGTIPYEAGTVATFYIDAPTRTLSDNVNTHIYDEKYGIIFPTKNFYIMSTNGRTGGSSGVYLYGLRIYQNDSLIKDYYPCRRKSDNIPGLYETKNGEFLIHSVSNSIEAGPDI